MEVEIVRHDDPIRYYQKTRHVERDPVFREYIDRMIDRSVERISDDRRDFYIENVNRVRENYLSDRAVAEAKDLLIDSEETSVVSDDYIRMVDIEEVHRVGPTMSRYLMLEPTIYKAYRKGNTSGLATFEDKYKDVELKYNPDYLESINGVCDRHTKRVFTSISKNRHNNLTVKERRVISNMRTKLREAFKKDKMFFE